MGILLIGGLLVLVVHAACKVNAAEQAASASQQTPLPPNTAIAATGNQQAPSPATALGAPGAASQYSVKLNTNSQLPTNAAGAYTVTGTIPGTNGVPQALIPAAAWAGFNSTPVGTKQLATGQRPGLTRTIQYQFANNTGVPVRL